MSKPMNMGEPRTNDGFLELMETEEVPGVEQLPKYSSCIADGSFRLCTSLVYIGVVELGCSISEIAVTSPRFQD